jgi:lysophospholipase L1-like esterase
MPEAPITETLDGSLDATASADKAKAAPKFSLTRTIIELVIFTPVAILALEAFFAITGVGEQDFMKPDLELGSTHIPGKLITWRLEGYSRDYFSKAGWRDIERTVAKPAGTYRIALIGDSQTEALQVPLERNWARQCEKLLNKLDQAPRKEKYEVLNFGVSGYSTAQELLLLKKEVLKYQPDLIVTLYSRGDSQENVVEPDKRATAEPRPFYYLDESGKLQLDDSVLKANRAKLSNNPLLDFVRRHSRIYGVYNHTNFTLNLTDKVYFRLRRFFTQISAKVFGSPVSNEAVPQYAPQDVLKVTQALIREIHNTASANHADFLLLTFPDMGNIDPVFASQMVALRQQSKNENFDLLELSQPFRDYKGPEALFYQVHFAQGGNDVAARTLADYVAKKRSLIKNTDERQEHK